MNELRSKRTYRKYMKFKAGGFLADGCNLCKNKKGELLKNFKYWKILKNIFPYDLIAETHHMLMPKRHVAEKALTKKEKQELFLLKHGYVEINYEFMLEGTHKKKSIPGHFHIHLLKLKKNI